ncbi:cytochrome c oxidase subunit I [Elioraea rosea]|uniref:cytochrome c oxidase subunit I n=1 Tax=Elioraea rosea TaxID=2492390 RepID=UPI001182A277|nr:cytochrome c oxidase subunit I [Elioraea rosea]
MSGDAEPAAQPDLRLELARTWSTPQGWWGVIVNVNHTDLGKRFMAAAAFYFCVAGILSMLIRAQLASPRSAFVGPEIYNQIFTMHGTLMMFMFAIPMFEGLALYLLPKMLGARDMAFPRLTAYGWWCYVFGGMILLASMLVGKAPDGGWFMYTPLSSRTYTPGINADIWLLGVTFVEISAVCAAVEITVTILKLRAPGMSLDKMPLVAWYLLVTALMMVFGFPPLILGSVLLEVERAFGWPFFDPARGGDALLWQHLFWLFGHPEVYIIFLPAAGVISTIIPVMARTRIVGYGWIVAAIFALAILSFGLWVHHMFTVGIPHMALAFFSAASTLVAIPTGIQVFAWLATLWQGRPELKLPMLYLLGMFVVFVMGGLTGVMLAVVPFNWQAHDTAFVTAHLHYVLVGGFVFPMLAAIAYWLPHVTGRQRLPRLGEAAFWLIFVGFHATFFFMHIVGLMGMRRRIDTYHAETGWTLINALSSVGSYVMAFGFALFLGDCLMQRFVKRRAAADPWGATTLEWAMAIPPRAYNFVSLPSVRSRDPLADEPGLTQQLKRGEGYLARVREGLRETLGVETSTGRIEQIVVLPGNSALPFIMALVTGGFFLSMLAGLYWIAPAPVLGVVVLACRWAWQGGARADVGPLQIGRGERAPPHPETTSTPGWWGSVFTLCADATFFASLVFGFAFLWVVAPNWPPPACIGSISVEAAIGIAAPMLAVVAVSFARAALRRGALARAMGACMAAGVLVFVAAAGVAAIPVLGKLPDVTAHAYAAVAGAMLAYLALHLVIAFVMLGFAAARLRAGYMSALRMHELAIVEQWTRYAAVVAAIVLVILLLSGACR